MQLNQTTQIYIIIYILNSVPTTHLCLFELGDYSLYYDRILIFVRWRDDYLIESALITLS